MKKSITLFFVFVSFVLYSQSSPGLYTIKNAKINTSYSDFGTAFFGKDKVIFASPKQGITFTREERNNRQQPFLDLFIGEVSKEGGIIKKQKMPGDINTKYHEGVVSFTKDMKSVYFTANSFIKKKKRKKLKSTINLQLFKASINEKGEWTNLEWLPFNNEKFSSGHPTLNKDDTKLYFVSDRPESIGKTDIYVVDIYEDGTYGEPINLGPRINTVERDLFPFISDDNVLYFSSDGYQGYGELDVFASQIFDNTVSEPINLEGPINSDKDDFAYIINDTNNKGYYSSNREGGKGSDDIYSFTASPPIFFECKQIVSGFIKDTNTLEILPKALIVLLDKQNKELQKVISNENDGSFSFEPACNTPYKIRGYIDGYLISEIDIKTVNDLDVGPLEIIMNVDMDKFRNMIKDPEGTDLVQNKDMIMDSDKVTESDEIQNQVEDLGKVRDTENVTESDKVQVEGMIASRDKEKVEELSEVRDTENVTESDKVQVEGMIASRDKVQDQDQVEDLGEVRDRDDITESDELQVKGMIANRVQDKDQVEDLGEVGDTDDITESEKVQVAEMNRAQNKKTDIVKDPDTDLSAVNDKNTVNINTIYFDFNKYNIRYDAKLELDKIAVVLKEYPEIEIDVNSHTDSRGENAYNFELSISRASATIEYLVDKGIKPHRISGKGFGEIQLATNCPDGVPCTGYQHQLNRRSEFSIIKNGLNDVTFRSNNRSNYNNYDLNDTTTNSGAFVNYDFSNDTEVFTVQIGAFHKNVQTDKFSKLTNLFNHRYDDGFNRYYAGIFETSNEARSYLKQLRKRGFEGAFVVGLNGKERSLKNK
jgi:outer membrane protein OmpA-like peptidoglycan-associated protein